MKKGILFDMDGTLWDSARQVAESWNLAAAESGYPDCHLTTEDIRSVMGKTMDKIAAQLFPFTKGQERRRFWRPAAGWRMTICGSTAACCTRICAPRWRF